MKLVNILENCFKNIKLHHDKAGFNHFRVILNVIGKICSNQINNYRTEVKWVLKG